MKTLALAVLLLGAAASRGAAQAPAAAKAAEVKTSTKTLETALPSSIYTAEKLRDPFQVLSSASGIASKPFAAEDFNIHNLALRGIMRDRAADYALFADLTYGVTFILRAGRLFDPRGKPVAGVTGSLNLKQKTAHLMTRESDVQVFRLGEESKE